ncbi:MAG: hypothetical protein HY329_12190 [Chloroflexi bacterium]|nr:hypothetical protein [Chloroflexota bacterium]
MSMREMGGNGQPSDDEQFPTLASSESFEIWDDPQGDSFVIAFNANGVTVAVNRADFPDLARVIAEAARNAGSNAS